MSEIVPVPVSMLTTEIAEVTGKKHPHVMRDVRRMLRELHGEAGLSRFGSSYRAANGKQEPCFDLPKRETMVLVTGYSISMRAAVIDRLEALEAELRARADAEVFALPGPEGLTRDQLREDLRAAFKHFSPQIIERVVELLVQALAAAVRSEPAKAPSAQAISFLLGGAVDKEMPRFMSAVKAILRNRENWQAAGLMPAPLPTPDTTFLTATEVCWRVVPDADLHRGVPGVVAGRLLFAARLEGVPQRQTEVRGRGERPRPTYPLSFVNCWLASDGAAFIRAENDRLRTRSGLGQGILPFPRGGTA